MIRAGFIFNHADIVGGGELSFIELADTIRAFDVDPAPIVPGAGEVSSRAETLGIETVTEQFPSLRGAGILRFQSRIKTIAQTFAALRLDLVHANGARCMLYAGPAARRAGIPCLWHVRVAKRDRLLDRVRSGWADAIVANSGFVAATLPIRTGRRKPYIVYNGVDTGRYADAARTDIRARFGLPAGPVVVGIGRMSPEKRFEDLVEAVASLRKSRTDCSLLMIGSNPNDAGRYERWLRELVDGLRLQAAAFCGWTDDIPSILKSADIHVVTASDEGFGRTIPEAWACGIPVIAAASGGPAELIRDGIDGLLVRPGSPAELAMAIGRLVADRDLRDRLTAAGRERAPEFTLENHARRIADIYRQMIDRTPGDLKR